jgi:large subunit ribosomal protein L9
MKVMLLKDIYKLGNAGDVKKVADGYARNYLIPQGLAVIARPGVLKQAERIRATAAEERDRLNQELGEVAERLSGLELTFAVKAGETGRLYGSVTSQMIATAIEEKAGAVVERRNIETQPIKLLGVHSIPVRLTIDLVPEVTILIHREGEPAKSAYDFSPEEAAAAEAAAAEAAATEAAAAEVAAEEEAPAEEEELSAKAKAKARRAKKKALEAEDEPGEAGAPAAEAAAEATDEDEAPAEEERLSAKANAEAGRAEKETPEEEDHPGEEDEEA